MLTDQEKERIQEEESFRTEIRNELNSLREKHPKSNSTFLDRLISSDNTRWLATTIAIPLSVAVWGFYTNRLAEQEHAAQERASAEQRQQERDMAAGQRSVELVIELLPALEKPPGTISRLNAIAVVQTLEKVGKLTPELRAAFENGKTQIAALYDPKIGFTNPGAQKEAEYLASIAKSDQRYGYISENNSQIGGVIGSQVYIQIFSENQKEIAYAVQKAIRDIGVGAPGIENVTATAQARNRTPPNGYKATTLLVFQESAMPTAQRVVDAVKRVSGESVTISPRWDVKEFKSVPAGQLELWFSNSTASDAAR